jgi:hypothetical protein
VSQGNLSYNKIHPLHNLFKGCTEGHCGLKTFCISKEDCIREIRYFFFTYDDSYTIPHQAQRQLVGGTNSTPPAKIS